MDVGGTLTKIVYFEPKEEGEEEFATTSEPGAMAASKRKPLSRSGSSSSLAKLEDPEHKAAMQEL